MDGMARDKYKHKHLKIHTFEKKEPFLSLQDVEEAWDCDLENLLEQ